MYLLIGFFLGLSTLTKRFVCLVNFVFILRTLVLLFVSYIEVIMQHCCSLESFHNKRVNTFNDLNFKNNFNIYFFAIFDSVNVILVSNTVQNNYSRRKNNSRTTFIKRN